MNDMSHIPLPAGSSAPLPASPMPSDRLHADNLMQRLHADLAAAPRERVNAATLARPEPEPREPAIARAASAGIAGICEAMAQDVEKQIAACRAEFEAIEKEGHALIETLLDTSRALEDRIREFAEMQNGVRLALTTANNRVSTFRSAA